MADDDKTEDATPYRLEEARAKGDVPNSRDFTSFVVLSGFALCMYFSGKHLFKHVIGLIKHYFDSKSFHMENNQEAVFLLGSVIREIVWMVLPPFAGVFVFGLAASICQFGFLFSWDKLTPDFDRLNPLKGVTRIFSKDTVAELTKSIIKISVISGILYLVLKGELRHFTEIGAEPIAKILLYMTALIVRVFSVMLMFFAFLGIVDLAYTRWTYSQKMKMSMQEVKDEVKQKDGDPMVRSRIRQIQRERARSRMMEAVPQADVVVTNPTHVAVALRYERGVTRAPMVVAKGAGYIALKIKELAAEAQVPILERKQLARYLYKNVEIGEAIPESLYTAVAEILAYVYRVKKTFKAMKRV